MNQLSDQGLLDCGPAMPAQLGFIAESTLADRPGTHLEQVVLEAPAILLSSGRLGPAWAELAARHAALRHILRPDASGQIRCLLLHDAQIKTERLDWSALEPAAQAAQQAEFLARDRARGIDPAQGLGWRVTTADLGGGRGWMVWTIHHALIDGTSIAIVLAELWALLNGQPLPPLPEALPAPAPQKSDTASFFQEHLGTGRTTALLPAAADGPAPRMAQIQAALDPTKTAALRAQVKAAGATMLNAVQGAWGLVLARWTGQPAACFGLVGAGRLGAPDADRRVGCFITTLPVKLDLPTGQTVSGLLASLRRATRDLRAHQHTELADIRRWSGFGGDVPLFDTVLVHASATLQAQSAALGADWARVDLHEEGAALATLASYDGDSLRIVLEHDSARLPPHRAARMLDHLQRLLGAIATAAPDTPLGALDMLAPDETAELLARGRPLAPLTGGSPCIAARFETMAAGAPEALAVLDAASGAALSYAALDGAANALAARLTEAGIGTEDIVALHLPRGTEFVVGLLGVMKAGAAVLPLDPEQSAGYLKTLLDRAGARALVAPQRSPLAGSVPLHLVPDGASLPVPPPRLAPDPARFAYLLFTSGSTGEPKGVMGTQGALCAHADAVRAAYGLSPADRVLQFAALGFDVALEEIIPTLLSGATLVLRDDGATGSIPAFLDLVAQQRINVLNLPASFWHALVADLAQSGASLPPDLRLMVTGSERISPSALAQWDRIAPDIGWINGYGPTEATITATIWQRPAGAPPHDPGTDVPIGRPLGHAKAVLRAPDGSLTPDGAEGLLWIGGAAVTRGYLHGPAETAAAFVDDPWHPGERLYNTGDRAVWGEDEQLRFLGRIDRQIKLRGHRIDLHQIETALCALADVRAAHAALDAPKGGGLPRLLAWAVCDPAPDKGTELGAALAARLPRYMLPQVIVVPGLPLGPNGKIDTTDLPRPVAAATIEGRTDHPPSDAQTKLVQQVFAAVLGCEEVGPDQSFFDLGGHSLLALRLGLELEKRCGQRIDMTRLLKAPTPSALAAQLRETKKRGSLDCMFDIQPEGAAPPLYAVQILGPELSFFKPLAQHLGKQQPVFGVTVDIFADETPNDLREIAAIFSEAIVHHRSGKPVKLIGVSQGAYFAFELAEQLMQAGVDVLAVYLIDVAGPDGRTQQFLHKGLRHYATRLLCNPVGVISGGLAVIREATRFHKERLRLQRRGLEILSVSKDLTVTTQMAAIDLLVKHYQPRPYSGTLRVIRARDNNPDTPETIRDALGWRSWGAQVNVIEVAGGHLTVLQEPNVAHLAQVMRDDGEPSSARP